MITSHCINPLAIKAMLTKKAVVERAVITIETSKRWGQRNVMGET